MNDEIIVGCGASALTHLYYATQTDFTDLKNWRVKVIGKDDLWGKIAAIDPGHRFGQPPQIVSLEGKQATVNINPKNPTGFQTAQQIDSQLEAMRDSLFEDGVDFIPDLVTAVDREGGRIRVKTATKTYYADRVTVATGFGRSALPRCEMPNDIKEALKTASVYKLKADCGQWFNLIMGGTEYLWTPNIPTPPPDGTKFRVAIQGSSATSSWVVLRAIELNRQRGAKANELEITWISRSGFDDANPAGRNSDVLKVASDSGWLTKAEVKSIGYSQEFSRLCVVLDEVKGGAPKPARQTTLGEAYQQFYKNTYSTKRALDITGGAGLKIFTVNTEIPFFVDHFIYALGADPSLPGGAGDILSQGLQGELEPVLDSEKRFDDDPSATTLGFKTKDGKVWVVGSAVFRGVGIKRLEDLGRKYSNISKMMCEAGSPPEGIAAIIAGAKALTGWKEDYSQRYAAVDLKKLNVQVADFKEIETWFGELYAFKTKQVAPATTKRIMADQVVALRKHTVFGLSAEEVAALGDPNNKFWDDMFTKDSSGKFMVDVIANAK
jgi:hypothetical protein